MPTGKLLIVVSAVVAILQKDGLLDVNGNFTKPSDAQIVQCAKDVEDELKAIGVTVSVRIDQILSILPLVLSFIGS